MRENGRTFKERLDERALRTLKDAADLLASSDRVLANDVARALAVENVTTAKWLHAALLDRLGQYGEAVQEFEAIPRFLSPEIDAVRLTALSRACLAAGDFRKPPQPTAAPPPSGFLFRPGTPRSRF